MTQFTPSMSHEYFMNLLDELSNQNKLVYDAIDYAMWHVINDLNDSMINAMFKANIEPGTKYDIFDTVNDYISNQYG